MSGLRFKNLEDFAYWREIKLKKKVLKSGDFQSGEKVNHREFNLLYILTSTEEFLEEKEKL